MRERPVAVDGLRRARALRCLPWALAVLVALWAGWGTLQSGLRRGFWGDDFGLLPYYLVMPWWKPMVTRYAANACYRPLGAEALWVANQAIGGMYLLPWKALQAALHAGNLLLLFALIRRHSGAAVALPAVALWGGLPHHIDARTWTADLPCLLGAAVLLAGLLAYQTRPLTGTFLVCLAIATKELYVFAGVALLAVDLLAVRRVRWRYVLPAVALGLAWAALVWWLSRSGWIIAARASERGGGPVVVFLRYWLFLTQGIAAIRFAPPPDVLLLGYWLHVGALLLASTLIAGRRAVAPVLLLAGAAWAVAFIYFAPRYTYLPTAFLFWWAGAAAQAGLLVAWSLAKRSLLTSSAAGPGHSGAYSNAPPSPTRKEPV